jgi:hypothetical protein
MLDNRYTDYMFGLVKTVIDEIGPRPSCSEEEKRLGRLLVDEWKSFCDRIDVEIFTCHPSAFLGFIPFAVLLYFAAVILYWFFPPLSLVMITIMLSVSIIELNYREFVDFLFPRKQGENIIGVIRPRGEANQRVVVSAHLDSAYEFNLLYYLKNAAVPILAIAILGLVIVFAGSLAKTIAYGSSTDNAQVFTVVGIIIVVLSPVVGLLLYFHTYRPVPGAMDNMAGIAVVSGLGKYLNEAKSNGNCYPNRTEVVLLATSSEEAGLRGAKRYVSKHLKEMKETPTYGLFLDCIYDEKFLTVAKREIFTGATHDHYMVSMAQEVAAIHSWPIAARVIPIGATDASAFSLRGIPSTCLLCQDISRLVPNYHTRNDTYEYIRPESLSVTLQVVIDMIERIDRN